MKWRCSALPSSSRYVTSAASRGRGGTRRDGLGQNVEIAGITQRAPEVRAGPDRQERKIGDDLAFKCRAQDAVGNLARRAVATGSDDQLDAVPREISRQAAPVAATLRDCDLQRSEPARQGGFGRRPHTLHPAATGSRVDDHRNPQSAPSPGTSDNSRQHNLHRKAHSSPDGAHHPLARWPRLGQTGAMLILDDISLRVAGRLLIDHASLTLPAGAKAGLVGRNGTGKTTLFRAITGDLATESGRVSMPKGTRIGQVAQEAPGTEDPLIDIVLAADRERLSLMQEAETATDAHRIAEIQTRLADIDAHSAEARAATILAGLGFDVEAQKRPASSFSGGWRMRVALAAVLFSEPDLLLLDEPTNYLDLEGTMWLESYLAKYPHTVLLISHDRDLLNRAVDSIVHLESHKLTFWRGGYDQFERQRAEKMELLQKSATKQDAKRKHMQAFVDRFRYSASKARQAQSRPQGTGKDGAGLHARRRARAALLPSPPPTSRLPHPSSRWTTSRWGYYSASPSSRISR